MGSDRLPVDEALLGRWILTSDEASALPDSVGEVFVEFDSEGPTTLSATYAASRISLAHLPDIEPEMLISTTFLTDVGATPILNMMHVAKEGAVHYRFYRYDAGDRFLRLWEVQDGPFKDDENNTIEFTDAEALRDYAAARVERNDFFSATFELYVRPDVAARDVFLKGIEVGKVDGFAAALAWLKPAANLGDPNAQYLVGAAYMQGNGVAADTAEALAYFERAAQQGHAEAQHQLGHRLDEGYWTTEDGERVLVSDAAAAARWWRRAAEHGLAEAQYHLGDLYHTGKGVAQDYAKASACYERAAEQGHAKAQYKLGHMHQRHGGETSQHYQEAAKWYRRAADKGDPMAQNALGSLYYRGQGLPQDYSEAAAWFAKAADQGFARAQYNLGVSYENGQGVSRDLAKARQWYQAAAEQGFELAVDALAGSNR